MLNIGCHLSTSKGFENMGKEALQIGGNTFQFFTRNPRGGKAKDIDPKDVEAFLKLAKEVKFTKEKKNFFVHYHCVEETSWKSDTFSSLFEKYRKSVDKIENKIEDKNDLSNVELYLVCIHRKNKSASTYHFSLADLKNYTVGTKYSDITDKLWLNEKIFNTEN